jgi:predicted amidohydrolase YtcJ
VTALVVDGPTVAWLGHDADADPPAATAVVDLDGALVTPAFVDAHVHATATGLALTSLDLSNTRSLAEALDAVARATQAGRGRPILGSGWDEGRWPERRPPTSAELDRAAYGGSVYLARVDAHSAVVSSVLLAAARAANPDLAELTGFGPDGWLRRDAHDAVRRAAFAALGPAGTRAAQRAALGRAAALGIGCLHEMAGPAISSEADLTALLELAASEPLPEVIGYWGELLAVTKARELGAVGAGGDLFCDGSLGSHTAALSAPYTDRPGWSGQLRFEMAELAEHVRQCVAAGLQAGFHAIGDAAVDQVLDALELAADGELHGHGPGVGHRIEHAEMVSDPTRLAASGLVASVQPGFDAAWGGPAGMYAQRLGVARAGGLNRFAELAAAGVPLAFGSDAPVTALGPWAAVRAAVAPSDPNAALSPAAAFAAHTTGGWRAAGRPEEGQLAVGRPATFAVWHSTSGGGPVDWFAPTALPDLSPAAELPTCLRTVVRGVSIFEAD